MCEHTAPPGSTPRFHPVSRPIVTVYAARVALKPGTSTALAVGTGVVFAGLYFRESERSYQEDGRSYLSPWTIDVATWGAGATLIWLGYRKQTFLVTFIGAGIATLAVARLATRKMPAEPTLGELVSGRIPLVDRSPALSTAELNLLALEAYA